MAGAATNREEAAQRAADAGSTSGEAGPHVGVGKPDGFPDDSDGEEVEDSEE